MLENLCGETRLFPIIGDPITFVKIPSESLASVEFPLFGSSKKPGLTRFAGVGRNLGTKAAYSQIRPPSETRNQLGVSNYGFGAFVFAKFIATGLYARSLLEHTACIAAVARNRQANGFTPIKSVCSQNAKAIQTITPTTMATTSPVNEPAG